jgi:hypothetical protein
LAVFHYFEIVRLKASHSTAVAISDDDVHLRNGNEALKRQGWLAGESLPSLRSREGQKRGKQMSMYRHVSSARQCSKKPNTIVSFTNLIKLQQSRPMLLRQTLIPGPRPYADCVTG